MKNKMTLVVIALFISCLANAQSHDFSGEWRYNSDNTQFSLSLIQKGNQVTGSYCAITNNGNKIDCNEKNSILGSISNNIANVKFTSASWDSKGDATIKLLPNGNLEWNIISQFGKIYAPQKVILKEVIKVKLKSNF